MSQNRLMAALAALMALAFSSAGAVPLKGISAEEIAQAAALLDDKPAGLGTDYHDRTTWDALAADPKFAKAIPEAEKLLKGKFPPWSQAAYDDYARTGSRKVTSNLFDGRAGWLSPMVTAECLENKGRFVPLIDSILKEYVKQPTWQPPYNDPVPVKDRSHEYGVGLEAAIFARNLAQALYLLDDKVDPKVRADVLAALHQRVFDPVLASCQTGKGHWWLTARMNWNSVCLAGVTGAALTVLPTREERAVFAAIGEHYSAYGLAGYLADGYDPEGPGYYNYGFGYYITLREALWKTTHGRIDLFKEPKVHNVALYGPRITIMNGWVPPYEDCHFGTRIDPVILWYCSRNLGLGLKEYDSLPPAGYETDLVRECFESLPGSATEATPAAAASPGEGIRSYFDKAQVLTCRPAEGGRIGASMKGGNNDKPHNHNDVGTYVIVAGKEELAGCPGGPFIYNSKTFGPERYTAFKTFVSYAQPLPVIAGRQQVLGAKAQAEVVKQEFTDQRDVFALEIRSAYPAPELQSMVRTFVYSREGLGSLSVSDVFRMAQPEMFETAIVSHADWKRVAPDTIEFTKNGETLFAKISASADWELTVDDVTEDAPTFHRLGIRLKQPAASGRITVLYTPGPAPAGS